MGFISLVQPAGEHEAVEDHVRNRLALCGTLQGDERHVRLGFPRRASPRAGVTRQPDVSWAFDVYAKSGDKEVRIGRWLSAPGWGRTGSTLASISVPRDANVSLVLRPNPLLAATTVDVKEIWGGEIVINDAVWVDDQGNAVEP